MSKRQFNPTAIDPSMANWDAAITGNFSQIEQLIEAYPFPVFEVDNAGSLPTASDNDRSIAFYETTAGVWELYVSDGSSWKRLIDSAAAATLTTAGLVQQAAAVADIGDPSTATAEDCANKLNELLSSLRAAGVLAT